MNRRNGNWLAPSINQLTATAVTDLAASATAQLNPLRCIQLLADEGVFRHSEASCGGGLISPSPSAPLLWQTRKGPRMWFASDYPLPGQGFCFCEMQNR